MPRVGKSRRIPGLLHMKISWLVTGITVAFRRESVSHLPTYRKIFGASHPKSATGTCNFPLHKGPEFHMR